MFCQACADELVKRLADIITEMKRKCDSGRFHLGDLCDIFSPEYTAYVAHHIGMNRHDDIDENDTEPDSYSNDVV